MTVGICMLPPVEGGSRENVGEKWKQFQRVWDSYALATSLSDKAEHVQVVTLLIIFGEEAQDMYSTFNWTTAGDS